MHRTVSNTRKSRETRTSNNEAEQDSEKQQQNVIKVNVIILNSVTGRSLQLHLYGSDEADGVETRRVSSQVILRRHTSLQPTLTQQQVSFSPVLTAVRESFEETSGNIPQISLTRACSVTQEARNSATRRWSQLGALGSTVARLSLALKKTKEDEIDEIQEEEVTLRKESG
jgi:hypothetical protein